MKTIPTLLVVSVVTTVLGASVACRFEPERPAGQAVDGTNTNREAAEHVEPKPVWLDVDPAIGLPEREVDDGLMMLQAFHSPEISIRGISVVFGNTEFENALPIARDVTERFAPRQPDGTPIGVFPGAHSANQLGEDTEAVRAMATALEREPLTLLAVGPLTNAASLLMLHPELHDRLEAIVIVAGRRPGQSFQIEEGARAFRDFNFELDPVAMQVLLDSDVRLVLAPWEVSSKVWIGPDEIAELASRGPVGQWAAENTATWLERWQTTLGAPGFNPFDTLAVAWVTHPELLSGFEGVARITEGPDDTQPGSGVTKPLLVVEEAAPGDGSERSVLYLTDPAPEFQALLIDRIAGQ